MRVDHHVLLQGLKRAVQEPNVSRQALIIACCGGPWISTTLP